MSKKGWIVRVWRVAPTRASYVERNMYVTATTAKKAMEVADKALQAAKIAGPYKLEPVPYNPAKEVE